MTLPCDNEVPTGRKRIWRERLALWLAPWLKDEIEALDQAYRWVQAGLDATRDT